MVVEPPVLLQMWRGSWGSTRRRSVTGSVRAYREQHAEDEPPLQVSERARLRELERLNRELEMENAFLKKGVPRTLEAA